MTLEFPTPAAPTSILPLQPANPNNPSFPAPLPPWAGFPANSAALGITILQAIGQGILPAQVQVLTYTPPGGAAVNFGGYLNPTLNSLMQSGLIPLNATVNTLGFATSANYGGN
jgi:hypothetical protein